MSSWNPNEGGYPTHEDPMTGFEVSGPRDFPGLSDETTAAQPLMMLDTRKNPEAEWQLYKEEIKSLYLTENKTKEDVMTTMEKTHGFQASKAQYVRHFDLWGFKKNLTNEKWNYIARKLQKRDLDGKESDTYINGKLMPRKKIKKEVSRHAPPSWQIMSMTAPSPPPPGGIEVRTPPQAHGFFVEYLHIPWFEFETLVEPQIKHLRALAYGHHATPSLGYDHLPQISPNFTIQAPAAQTAIATEEWLHQVALPRGQIGDAVRQLGNDNQGQILNPSTGLRSSRFREETPDPISHPTQDQEARSLFANILGKSIDPDSHDYLSRVTSHLDDILIERQDGDITRNVQRFFGSPTFEIALQLLRYSVYLSSNNLLSDDRTDDLLRWVVRSGQFAAIEHLIKMKTATTEVFGSNILLSATRMEDNETVRSLVALGIDVNIPGGDYPKDTALFVAVSKAKNKFNSGPESQCFSLVKSLLEAGADVNVKSGYHDTPLQMAISKQNARLVQMLLSARIALNAPINDKEFPKTAPLKPATDGDSPLNAKSRVKPVANPSMITLLQDAAMRQDLNAVQSLLDSGADFDAPAGVSYDIARQKAVAANNLHHLQSAIQIAAANGETEMVQVLLEAGANVDGYFPTEEEYLVCESIAGRDFEADEREAQEDDDDNNDSEYDDNEDDRNEDNNTDDDHIFYWTPLQSAIANKDAVLVRVLLQAGASIEGRGVGSTPLQLAVLQNDTNLVHLMLRKGADINAPAYGVKGRTAVQAAVKNRYHNLVEILVDENADLNAPANPTSGFTVLQAAAKVENFELVRRLISLGADINASASPIKGRTCLQAAAENGDTKLVQFLLSSGAEVNAAIAVKGGLSALQAAARGNHLSVVKILLAAGADVNAPSSKGGYSAVYAAVKRSNLEMLQLFLKTASPNGQGDRVPPLLKASRKGATEVVKCLLQRGADINASPTEKTFFYASTAIETALENSHENIFSILLDAGSGTGVNGQVVALGAALGAALIYCCARLNMDVVRKLLRAGADVNITHSNYKTLLLSAVYSRNLDLVQTLLEAGANTNAPAATEKGRTALQAAAEYGDPSLVRLLLEHGADCNAPAADSRGVTALQAAAIRGHLPIALTLLNAGADINTPAANSDGRTALEAAAWHGRLDIVSLFLKNDNDTEGLENRCERAAELAEKNGHIHISRILRDYNKD